MIVMILNITRHLCKWNERETAYLFINSQNRSRNLQPRQECLIFSSDHWTKTLQNVIGLLCFVFFKNPKKKKTLAQNYEYGETE